MCVCSSPLSTWACRLLLLLPVPFLFCLSHNFWFWLDRMLQIRGVALRKRLSTAQETESSLKKNFAMTLPSKNHKIDLPKGRKKSSHKKFETGMIIQVGPLRQSLAVKNTLSPVADPGRQASARSEPRETCGRQPRARDVSPPETGQGQHALAVPWRRGHMPVQAPGSETAILAWPGPRASCLCQTRTRKTIPVPEPGPGRHALARPGAMKAYLRET